MGKRATPSAKPNGKSKSLAAVKETKVAKKPPARKAAAAKQNKDPNQPKKPATAFFIFLEDFRKTYKRDHPNAKGVAVVGKAGGDKWKAMTDEEKAPFLTKAAKRKADYEKVLEAYHKKKDDKEEDESADESDKKAATADDEEEAEDEESEDEDDDDDR